MTKAMLILATILVLSTPVISYAQQQKPPQPAQPAPPVEDEELFPPSKFELFLERTDAVIVASSFEIGALSKRGADSGPEVTANVAWVLDENERIYAAKIGSVFVDFEDLKTLDDGIGKLLKAISESYEKLGATSMSYKTAGGILIEYFTFEALVDLRTLIGQAREKLVALGAK